MHRPKKIATSKVIHKNPYFQVRKDNFVHANDKKGSYYTVVVDPFVVIVALSNDRDKVYLVKNWRYPLQRYLWEFPMGRREKNETPLMAAKREMAEEIGYKARKWKSLGWFHLAPGTSNQRGYIFLAERLEVVKNYQPGDEIVGQKAFDLRTLKKLLKERKIIDSPTIVAAQRFFDSQ